MEQEKGIIARQGVLLSTPLFCCKQTGTKKVSRLKFVAGLLEYCRVWYTFYVKISPNSENLDYCIIQYTFYVNVVENFPVPSLLTELKDSLPEKMILFHTQLSFIIFWYLLLSGFESVLLFILNFLVQQFISFDSLHCVLFILLFSWFLIFLFFQPILLCSFSCHFVKQFSSYFSLKYVLLIIFSVSLLQLEIVIIMLHQISLGFQQFV